MKNYKRILACTMALGMVFSVTSCGKSSSDSNASTEQTFKEEVKVNASGAGSITAIPDSAQKTLIYLGEDDLNPSKRGNTEKSTELALFESKGGKIKFKLTTNENRFSDLASAIMSNKDTPDLFKYEWLAYPSQVVRDMYQPIDDIVDFKSSLWSGSKVTADQFMLDGKHYVAPLSFDASSLIFYDQSVIDDEGLDNPYDLWKQGKWTWSSFRNIMDEYIGNATNDEKRYGINGFFKPQLIQQTGKTMVTVNSKTGEFVNNLNDPDIQRGEDFLYKLTKDGLVLGDWIGDARDCFKKNCLFYAMGAWAASGAAHTPTSDEQWNVVPMPCDDNNPTSKITTSDMKAFMWVKGSKAKEAVKCWFECYRVSKTDSTYQETNKKKFFVNNPNWTEDMYSTLQNVVSDQYYMIFDNGYGVSSALGDRKMFDQNQCLVDALYGMVTQVDDSGVQSTWTQVRDKYSPVVDKEVQTLNDSIKKYTNK